MKIKLLMEKRMGNEYNSDSEFVARQFTLVRTYDIVKNTRPQAKEEIDILESKILESARFYLVQNRLSIDCLAKKIVYMKSQYWRMCLRLGAPLPFIELEPVEIIYVSERRKS